ncbi:hypothetical protein [Deinococcus sonorensis]|uniref:Uncharacterized protein n=2 Tax=Deinococcus sonorensis TaxID=309891 RepID=A0AAU7U8V3_9DEIO
MSAVPSRPDAVLRPPLWSALLLNLPLPGSGLTLLNRPWWHACWLLLQTLSLLAATRLLPERPALAVTLPLLVWLALQLHTAAVHRQTSAGLAPAGGTWPLILGLGVLWVALLAAVLPGLLAARTAQVSNPDAQYLQQVIIAAGVVAITGQDPSGPCDALAGQESLLPPMPEHFARCTVDGHDLDNPAVTATLKDGSTLRWPER